MLISEKISLFKKNEEIPSRITSSPSECESLFTTNSLNLYSEKNTKITSSIFKGNKKPFIGSCSYMNDGGYINSNVFIGRYCSIGRRVSIGAGYHSIDGLTSSYSFNSSFQSRPYTQSETEALGIRPRARSHVIIENDVWIGDGAVILDGVTIGTGSVIGANSVVNRDIPPYSIVGGIPAKNIKQRFPDNICNALIDSRWWEHDKDFLSKLPIKNIIQFLDFYSSHPEKDIFTEFETFQINK